MKQLIPYVSSATTLSNVRKILKDMPAFVCTTNKPAIYGASRYAIMSMGIKILDQKEAIIDFPPMPVFQREMWRRSNLLCKCKGKKLQQTSSFGPRQFCKKCALLRGEPKVSDENQQHLCLGCHRNMKWRDWKVCISCRFANHVYGNRLAM